MTDALAQEMNIKSTSKEVEEIVVSPLKDLWLSLARLDERLKQAVELARTLDTGKESDAFRGLYLSDITVDRLLSQQAGKPLFTSSFPQSEEPAWRNTGADSRMDWLAQAFRLSSFELDIVLVALAPEVDLRYQRLYAFLQDDVTRRHPSIDLALNLLCADSADKIERRRHFSMEAPLIRHNIIQLVTEPNLPHSPLLAHSLKLDEQIVNLLLHQQHLDSRLGGFCRVIEPTKTLSDLPLSQSIQQQLQSALVSVSVMPRPLCMYLQGVAGAGKQQVAEAIAGKLGMALLTIDLAKAVAEEKDLIRVSKLVFREAWFQNALLYFQGLDDMRQAEHGGQYEQWLDVLIDSHWPAIIGGCKSWVPGRGSLGLVTVELPIPEFAERRQFWQAHVKAAGLGLNEHDLDAVAEQFRFTPQQIKETVATLSVQAGADLDITANVVPNNTTLAITAGMLFAAARRQNNQALANLAFKIEPRSTWDDIVLPEDNLAQLHEICQRVQQRHRVLADWGFESKLSYGKGVNALFFGPSGTGKTMAAEVIAAELGLDLYKIDLSGVVSKYIGETEKNLDRIFRAAEDANAILFFDEADALFGKRSEVRDSHDRYANIEISYLLQKMEAYQGITILATNLRKNLDDAFVRRLAFCIPFPFPDETSRLHIWKGIWPRDTPVSEKADFEALAKQCKLSGGNIKNSALAAAFLAAEADSQVTMEHLLQAIHREYQKMGKVMSTVESQPVPTGTLQSLKV